MHPYLQYYEDGVVVQHRLLCDGDGNPILPRIDEVLLSKGDWFQVKNIIWNYDEFFVVVMARKLGQHEMGDFVPPMALCCEELKHTSEDTLNGFPNHRHFCARENKLKAHPQPYRSAMDHKCRCGLPWRVAHDKNETTGFYDVVVRRIGGHVA